MQYYYEVESAIRKRDGVGSNPESLAYNSSFKITRRASEMGKLDFMAAGSDLKQSYSRQRSFNEDKNGQDMQQRLELKQVLLAQIRQKEEGRRAERQR